MSEDSDIFAAGKLSTLLSDAAGRAGEYLAKKQDNYDARHCIWPGQSEDSRKHSRALGKQAKPWEGASDTRIRLSEMIISENKRILKTVSRKARVQCVPSEPGDIGKGQIASSLFDYVRRVKMQDEMAAEHELAIDIREMHGLAIMGIFWLEETRTEIVGISMEELETMAAEDPKNEALAAGLESLSDPLQDRTNIELLLTLWPDMKKRAAAAIVKDLRETGKASWKRPYVAFARPVWRALEPFTDIWFPPGLFTIKRSPWVGVRELLTVPELQEKVQTEDWNQEFVDQAATKTGQFIAETSLQQLRKLTSNAGDVMKDYVEIFRMFFRKSAPDGTQEIWEAIVHPGVTELEGKRQLFPYEHGNLPFVEMPRERISRVLLDARGVPELAKHWQSEIKAQRDYRGDRASISILPPLRVPANRGKLNLILGPASEVPERKPGEFSFMEPPRFDQGTTDFEKASRADADEYFGRRVPSVDPSRSMLVNEELAEDHMAHLKQCYAQTWQLTQQFMKTEESIRVTGSIDQIVNVSRAEIQGQYDIQIEFDVRDLDLEFLAKKYGFIQQVLSSDTMNVTDRAGLTRELWSWLDPRLAQKFVQSGEVASEKEVEETKNAFAQISNYVEPTMREGVNFQLRLQTLNQILQSSPKQLERMNADEEFKVGIEKYLKYLQFGIQQQQNAQTGRIGVSQQQPSLPA